MIKKFEVRISRSVLNVTTGILIRKGQRKREIEAHTEEQETDIRRQRNAPAAERGVAYQHTQSYMTSDFWILEKVSRYISVAVSCRKF